MASFEARRNKSFKIWVNHVLASELFATHVKPSIKTSWRQRICGQPASAKILVLESSELNTVRAFKAQGVAESEVHIPNPCTKVCDAISTAFPTAQVTKETVGDLIRTTQHKYDVVFLDYMCTVEGNKTTKPTHDVQQLFHRKLITTPGILATTFCKRNSQHNQQEKLTRQVFKSALENGYRITPVWTQVYQPSMVVTAYLVRDAVGDFAHEMEAFSDVPPEPQRQPAADTLDLVGKRIVWRGEKVLDGAPQPQWYPGRVVKRVGRDKYIVAWRVVKDVSISKQRTRERLSLENRTNCVDAPYGSWHTCVNK
jgi:hypothetical protein